MTGDEIQRVMQPGAVLEIDTPLHISIPVKVNSNRLVSADAGALGLTLGAQKDRGRWWTEGDMLCMKWFRWFDAKPRCISLRREGNRVYWNETSGESGTATLTEARPAEATVPEAKPVVVAKAKPVVTEPKPVVVAQAEPAIPEPEVAAAPKPVVTEPEVAAAPKPVPAAEQKAPIALEPTAPANPVMDAEAKPVAESKPLAETEAEAEAKPAVAAEGPPVPLTADAGAAAATATPAAPAMPEIVVLAANTTDAAKDAGQNPDQDPDKDPGARFASPAFGEAIVPPEALVSPEALEPTRVSMLGGPGATAEPQDFARADNTKTPATPAAAEQREPKNEVPLDTRAGTGPRTLYQVTRVRSDDELMMRSGPSEFHTPVGAISSTGRDIEIIGECSDAWCPVRHGTEVGWVNSHYLRVDEAREASAGPN